MKILSLARYGVVVTVGVGLLAGCSSGGSSLAPTGSSSAGSSAARPTHALMINGMYTTAEHPAFFHHAPISPDKKHHHKKKQFQYITDFGNSSAFEFDYPKGDSSIGSISNVSDPQGECMKPGKGTCWVSATGSAEVEEFKPGGTSPISTLSVTAGDDPVGCAINAKTGDLATTIINTGDVIVFAKAAGSGKSYPSGLSEAFFATYDKNGNLFVDGFNNSGVGVVELAKGGSSFSPVSLSNTIGFPGNIQWDGKYVTVNDQDAFEIYQYSVSGTTATLKGTVSLSGATDCDQTWIAKTVVYCPDAGAGNGKVYKYPAGGSPIATLTASFSEPIGAIQLK